MIRVRSTFPERQGHLSSRSARSDGLQHRVDHRRLLEFLPKASTHTQFFIPLCLVNHTSTDQVTTSLRKTITVSPSLLPAWGFGATPVTRGIARAIASSAMPVETTGRYLRRPEEDAGCRSPRCLSSGVRLRLCAIRSQKNIRYISSIGPKQRKAYFSRYYVRKKYFLFSHDVRDDSWWGEPETRRTV